MSKYPICHRSFLHTKLPELQNRLIYQTEPEPPASFGMADFDPAAMVNYLVQKFYQPEARKEILQKICTLTDSELDALEKQLHAEQVALEKQNAALHEKLTACMVSLTEAQLSPQEQAQFGEIIQKIEEIISYASSLLIGYSELAPARDPDEVIRISKKKSPLGKFGFQFQYYEELVFDRVGGGNKQTFDMTVGHIKADGTFVPEHIFRIETREVGSQYTEPIQNWTHAVTMINPEIRKEEEIVQEEEIVLHGRLWRENVSGSEKGRGYFHTDPMAVREHMAFVFNPILPDMKTVLEEYEQIL